MKRPWFVVVFLLLSFYGVMAHAQSAERATLLNVKWGIGSTELKAVALAAGFKTAPDLTVPTDQKYPPLKPDDSEASTSAPLELAEYLINYRPFMYPESLLTIDPDRHRSSFFPTQNQIRTRIIDDNMYMNDLVFKGDISGHSGILTAYFNQAHLVGLGWVYKFDTNTKELYRGTDNYKDQKGVLLGFPSNNPDIHLIDCEHGDGVTQSSNQSSSRGGGGPAVSVLGRSDSAADVLGRCDIWLSPPSNEVIGK